MNLYKELEKLNLKEKEPITLVMRDEGGNLLINKKKFFGIDLLIPYEGAHAESCGVNITVRNLGNNARFRFTTYPIQHFQELIIYSGHIDIDINKYKYVIRTNEKGENIRYLKYPNYSSEPFKEIAADYPDYIFIKL